MKEFLDNLHIAHDGTLHVNEVLGLAVIGVMTLIVILIIRDIIRNIHKRLPGRKKTIFSHRKNKYKTRINKKNKF